MRINRPTLPIVLILTLGFSLAARGEIYRWTDEQGRLHFTQSLDKVPPRYRAQAREGAARAPSRDIQVVTGNAAAPAPRPAPRPRASAPTSQRRSSRVSWPLRWAEKALSAASNR